MLSTTSLAKQLATDHPQITFVAGEYFRWSPDTRTISYEVHGTPEELLHELGHALLSHRDFTRDIVLLEMERDAWKRAQTLAPHYHLAIENDTIEDALDTYRDWLHQRSLCPACGATGIQTAARHYRCLACLDTWRVNDARQCALRRYKTT